MDVILLEVEKNNLKLTVSPLLIEVNEHFYDIIEITQGLPGARGADGLPGANGLSAYDIAVENGFTGTEEEWLASLHGSGRIDLDRCIVKRLYPDDDGIYTLLEYYYEGELIYSSELSDYQNGKYRMRTTVAYDIPEENIYDIIYDIEGNFVGEQPRVVEG